MKINTLTHWHLIGGRDRMFRSYLKIALRNFSRNQTFSFINIFGLAVGLTTCLLIMLYIFDESSYDKHHCNGDRIYRISCTSAFGSWAASAAPVAFGVKNALPDVEQATRLMTFPDIENLVLKVNTGGTPKQFLESNGYYADSTFFQIFTYDFKYGQPLTALDEPNSIVISDDISAKFFGSANPVGKFIVVNTPFGEFNYTVKGVFNKDTYKSHIPANFFLSMRNRDMDTWVENQSSWAFNNVFYTYVRLKEGTNPALFEQKLKRLYAEQAGKDLKISGISKSVFIFPMKDIYLHSSIEDEIAPTGDITYLYILGSIAAFILLIACVNFMNLSTARAEKRAKEVGVRKVVGAGKSSLVGQFLGESFAMALMALAIALVFTSLLLPTFNQLTNKNMVLSDRPQLLLWIIGLTLVSGLMAGLYPAFYLSAFKPVSVLKGKISNSLSSRAIRKGLVVFQFTISICLVLAAIVIWQQLSLFKNKQLGFDKDQQVVLPLQLGYNNSQSNFSALKAALLSDPHINSVTGGSSYPGIPNLSDLPVRAVNKPTGDIVDVQVTAIQKDYLETLGMTLLSGRTLRNESDKDSTSVILNETAVRNLGYTPETVIGEQVRCDLGGKKTVTLQVIGVVKDFNFESLHNTIKPFGFTGGRFGNQYSYLIANIKTKDYSATLAGLERAWKKVLPQSPFLYSFLDQDFQRNYEKEQLTSRIVIYFTIIAIVIACLGLLGLATFSAEQRTKEIGIRKVLGASASSITALLSKDLMKLVIVGMILAFPISGLIMQQWLQHFAYRIQLSWWMFAAAGFLSVLVALMTVSFQAIKAALANPVKSLRAE